MVNSDIIARLVELVGPANVLVGNDATSYEQEWRGRQRGKSLAVVRPRTTNEVSEVLHWCSANGVGIVPQGGNTGLAAGAIPDDSGTQILLNLCRLNAIRKVDIQSLTVTVEAGCTLHQLREVLAGQDMLFPLSLGSEGTCTIGGNLATNAGGAQVVRHGNARDLCLGLEYVTASGEIVSELGGLRKDNTGFDLRNLLIGSEGCLAVITAATLKFVDAPSATATAWAAVRTVDDALRLLRICQAKLGRTLSSFEFMNRFSLELVEQQFPGSNIPFIENPDAGYFVLLEADDTGSEEELLGKLESTLEAALESDVLLDAAIGDSKQRSKQLWLIRENVVMAQAKVAGVINFDISLPLSAIPAFLREAHGKVAQRWGPLPAVNFGHLGDGNLHYSIHTGTATNDAKPTEAQLRDLVYGVVVAAGGSFSAEHGIGASKAGYLARYKAGPRYEWMKSIKAALDPSGILNPGKMLATTAGQYNTPERKESP